MFGPIRSSNSNTFQWWQDPRFSQIPPKVPSSTHPAEEQEPSYEELLQEVRELRRSNAELERFAQVASHDLRSPLRGIRSIADWILEDCGDQMPKSSREDLQRLQSRVKRMESMLGSLLSYARVGKNDETSQRVDSGALISECIDLLSAPSTFSITMQGDFPELLLPKAALQRIFGNLLGNAVKHHHCKAGAIEVCYRLEDDFHEFQVTDDGPGIAEEFQEQIFELFRTLRPSKSDEVGGLGLALVEKSVATLGGQLLLKSARGQGSTFIVRLPLEASDKPSPAISPF